MRIGFVSTRFHGTDGVSLEAAKWAHVLEHDLGHQCFWFAGKLDTDPDVSHLCPEAFFEYPENLAIQRALFCGSRFREQSLSDAVADFSTGLKMELRGFIDRYEVDLLLPQNILAIPMHIPLGLAVTDLAEEGMPILAHHHDFSWERARFKGGCAGDYLERAFPPAFSERFLHIVINSSAGADLLQRRGVPSAVIPNVFDFEQPPSETDGYGDDFRDQLGIAADEVIVLQPTRVVPRKGIEFAIELCARLKVRLGREVCLVVSHTAGDEGFEYLDGLMRLAAQLGVRVLWVGDRVSDIRGNDLCGNKCYKLWDAYPHADLITYPSLYEGFGNALLETFYFSKPVVVNRYSVFVEDIEPHGFQAVTMDGCLTDEVVNGAASLIEDKALAAQWAEHNYRICEKHYSYSTLRGSLGGFVDELSG
ncbi:MAG: glycosyltransferase family 4 protein [Verrucomicrobiaceae bacterium]|nr:glycosyltransferase family 4 protein [Verrucomicrobiaceae bacterium]